MYRGGDSVAREDTDRDECPRAAYMIAQMDSNIAAGYAAGGGRNERMQECDM